MLHMYQKQNWLRAYRDRVVGSSDECDEKGQHHVDEEWDEGVKVDLAEDPHQCPTLFHLRKCHKHVVAIDQREEALRHHGQWAELWTKTFSIKPEREKCFKLLTTNFKKEPALRPIAVRKQRHWWFQVLVYEIWRLEHRWTTVPSHHFPIILFFL